MYPLLLYTYTFQWVSILAIPSYCRWGWMCFSRHQFCYGRNAFSRSKLVSALLSSGLRFGTDVRYSMCYRSSTFVVMAIIIIVAHCFCKKTKNVPNRCVLGILSSRHSFIFALHLGNRKHCFLWFRYALSESSFYSSQALLSCWLATALWPFALRTLLLLLTYQW